MNTTTVIAHVKLFGYALVLLCVGAWAAAVPPANASGPLTHIVSTGETLTAIGERYDVPLSDLISLNRLGSNAHVYAGQSLKIPATSTASVSMVTAVRLSGVPLLRQRQSLTCEEAAAAMAARGQFTEAQLVRVMARSPNPFEGIRGRTNAPVFGSLSDYGAYAQAVSVGLSRIGHSSTVLYGQSYAAFRSSIEAALRSGQPVVWWTTFRQMRQSPVNINLPNGSSVRMVRFEHAVTIVGMNARGFIYHDPYNATVRSVSFADHQRVSAYFNNMALLVDN
jgi:LysM repeat protein